MLNSKIVSDDPEYKVPMNLTTDISVLKSKKWFDWKDENVKLAPGQTLTFKTSSSYGYKEKGVYSSVTMEGSAYLTGIGSDSNELVQVAVISYSSATTSKGNPVLEFLKRSGKQVGQHILFPTGGHLLKDENNISEIKTPPKNQSYYQASADWNSIHCKPYFASLAALPGTITHGMWSSAATRSVLERVAAEGHGARVKSYDVAFTGMFSLIQLKIELKYIGLPLDLQNITNGMPVKIKLTINF